MKVRLTMLVFLLLGSVGALYAENSTSSSQNQANAQPQSKVGFGLQPTIFSEVRTASSNLANNISDMSAYKPTPGDIYTLTIVQDTSVTGTGATTASFPVQLNEDMTLDVPFIGAVSAKGKTVAELRSEIVRKVKQAVPVQYVNFLLTHPAEFNVFVYGGVNTPGYIVATPLVTVIDAISLARGFKNGASYRRVELFHNGKERTLDISKYYTEADMSVNPRLQPGDRIFVPQAKIIAKIEGDVKYPGSYELLPTESLQTLIDFAGGTAPGALTSRIEVSRIKSDGTHTMLSTSLTNAKNFKVMMGDVVTVPSTTTNSEVVSIQGAVYGKSHSGETPIAVPRQPVRIDFPYYPGVTILNLLDAVGGPTPYAKADKSYIVQHSTGRKIPVQLGQLWKTRDPALDHVLYPGDQVIVPMETLSVFVTGQVTTPGAEPYQPDLTVGDYLLAAGGIMENTGDPHRIYLVSLDGSHKKVTANETVPPGSNIYVAKKPLFQANQFFQNFFLTTGWVTTLISAASIIYNFLILLGVL